MGAQNRQDGGKWAGRPRAAFAVKLVAWLTPIVLSVLATYFLAKAVPRPRGLLPGLIWFLALSLIATGVLFVVDKIARRLLPLAALLQLSLVFPDRAPSRFRSALRTQTVHQLEARVAELKRDGLPDDPALAAETLIDLVAALSVHDRLTRGHAERVRAYTRMIGEELKLGDDDLERLTWAGLLHDVGKLFVPAEILNKPGHLTADEFEVIKGHPGWGAQLCAPLRGWLGDWVDAVGEHHERWDGKGYPSGTAGEDISLSARIVSVADVFDVITSVRSYKTAEGAVNGREELARCAGTQFDPAIVRAFLNISLGNLRLAMGPLSWFAQLPIVGRLPLAPAAGATASVAATATALMAAGVMGHATEPNPYSPEVQAAEVAPAPETTVAFPVITVPIAVPGTDAVAITIAVPEDPTTTAPPDTTTTTAPPDTTTIPVATGTPDTQTTPPTTTTTVAPTTSTTTTTTSTTTTTTSTTTTTTSTTTTTTSTTTTTVAPTTSTTTTTTTTPAAPPPPLPAAVDDAATIAEDSSIDIDVAANDVHALSASVTTPPPVGLVTQLSATLFRYTPPVDWHGATAFVYTIDDGAGNTASATVTVTVTPVPDPPIANDDTATTDEDTILVDLAALTNDTDPDGDTLTITGVSSTDGTPTTDGTTITYTPAPDSFGTHTISYTITDGTFTDTATITITVNPQPDPPTANDDTATTDEDTPLTAIAALTNDTDPDGDTLTITGVSSTDGTPTTDGTTITYTPAPDSFGTHTISYTITDGTFTDTATITITVNPQPDPPTANDDTATTDEDTPLTAIAALTNDTDPDGDTLTITGVSSTDGTPTTDGTTITYTPAPDTNGTHTISYTITDGTFTDTATITITVNPQPDPPTANDDTATTDEDTPLTAIAALTNDTDPDGDTLTITSASSPDGTVTTDGTTITYTPAPDTNGTHTITYTITDGTTTDTATITITVTPVPDPPTAVDDTHTTAQGSTLTALAPGVLGNDSDPDGDPLEATLVTPASDGTVTVQLDGSFVYVPNPLYVGTDSFVYQVDDGTGLTDTATVTIDVTSSVGIVISEFSNVGSPPYVDFIELYNTSASPIDIEGWTLVIADEAAVTQTIGLTGPSTLIPPGGHYLLATNGPRDQTMGLLADSVAIRVRNGATIHDEVGTRARNNGGSVPAALWSEGIGLPPLIDAAGVGASWERKSGRTYGSCIDTDDNSADFTRNFIPSQASPQRSTAPPTPCGTPVSPPAPTHLVISEYRTDGPGGGQDEFVEIFNPTSSPISLAGYELRVFLGGTNYTYPAIVLAPGQHYLVGAGSYGGPVDGVSGEFTNGESVGLYHAPSLTWVDAILVGGAPPLLPRLDGRMDQSYERRFAGCMDTDIWLDDIVLQASPTPQRSTDPASPC